MSHCMEEAIIFMVASNLQREHILPSERAKAYKMKMDAIKQQGRRTDLTSGPMVPKLSWERLGESNGESGRQISGYIGKMVVLFCPMLKVLAKKQLKDF